MSETNEQSFDSVWSMVQSWDGWLRPGQARRLWTAAGRVRAQGSIVEIGSFRGKSTAVLARGSQPTVRVHAIDPHAGNDRQPGEWSQGADEGSADHDAFVANLVASGTRDRIEHVREFSQRAHPLVPGEIDLLYVDGAHGYAPASDDLCTWGERVVPGGEMYVHDVFNSVWVTAAILRHLAASTRWRYLGRESSLAMYRREDVGARGACTNVLRHLVALPVLARSIVVRALRSIGREPWARVLGHRPGDGCY